MSNTTKIYFIRHAEAMGNVNEFFQGRTDCEVSEKGMKQLDCLAERFKDIDFDVLISSPLKRTVVTADAVNRYHGLDIIYDERLVEINGGVWEGVKWADIPRLYPEEYRLWTSEMSEFHVKDGESMREIFARMKNAVESIVEKYRGRTVAVVSHGCALRNYLCYAMGNDIEKLAEVGWADNTAVSLVEYDDELTPKIIFRNDASHLSDELSTLAHSNWCRYEDDEYKEA
ncbi:MAG: histidine phosphatase family protein [Oscillospiraceae bacterium]|nr:histidine phosphatase family protein [Oscillospiraceae bacterium]